MDMPLLSQLREQLGPAGLYHEALEGRLPLGAVLAEMGAALGYKIPESPEPSPSPPPRSLPALPLLLDNANSVSGPLALRAGAVSALAGAAGGDGGLPPPATAGKVPAGAALPPPLQVVRQLQRGLAAVRE
ncbi:hypothetical protein ABPG75_012198 [Micractinium tetrahymenae]